VARPESIGNRGAGGGTRESCGGLGAWVASGGTKRPCGGRGPERRERARPGDAVADTLGQRASGQGRGASGRGRRHRERKGMGGSGIRLIPCSESPHALIGGVP
jgi:hypothetical protein